MRLVTPLILVGIAIGLYIAYINPTYDTVVELQAEQASFDDALDRSKELMAIRDRLLNTYNSFSSKDIDRLEGLLPDHVDSVRLIIDIDGIAATHGLRVQDVDISTKGSDNSSGADSSNPVGIVNLGFAVESSYSTFKQFLADLEDSLRVLDVVALSFSASDGDLTKYFVTIKTYWLK